MTDLGLSISYKIRVFLSDEVRKNNNTQIARRLHM